MSRPLRVRVNGNEDACVSAVDRGLQYGDGVFETVAVAGGVPLLWARHAERLRAGCVALGFAPPDPAVLEREAQVVCAGAARAVLKCIVTRGAGGRGYRSEAPAPTRVMSLWPWPDYPAEYGCTGIEMFLCATRVARGPRLAGIKHLNRLEQVLARNEWGDGYAEGLMLDDAGHVVEGTMSNVFVAVQDGLITPTIEEAGVRGIMRACAIECAHARGIPVREEKLPLGVLKQAQEMFMTNSVIGVWPVRRFNQREYRVGEITQDIQAELRARGYTADGG